MEYYTTIGADVSDRTTKVCVMTKAEGGERRIVVETTCATTKAGFEEAFSKFDRSWPVVFETGMHCRWMDRLFRKMGFKTIVGNPGKIPSFKTIVGNPGKIPSITKSNTKNDRNDARELARLALADPTMLHPVFLRDEVYQQMLRFHHARNMLISQRTQTINQIRGFAKSMGHRIECSSTEKFHELSKADWPREIEECAWPLMGSLKTINLKIKAYDKLIARLAERPEFKPMVERALVAAIGGRPDRFDHTRDIGAYLGMIPKQDQSGDDDKQLHITHAGADIVRTALVECAGVAMMSNAKDTDLKLKGLRIAMRGGRIARKKAKVAVARGLAVTMLALLQHPEREYVPLSEDGKKGFERYRAELEYLTMQKASRKEKKVA